MVLAGLFQKRMMAPWHPGSTSSWPDAWLCRIRLSVDGSEWFFPSKSANLCGGLPYLFPKNHHPMEPKYRTLLQALFIAVLLGVVVHLYEPGAPGPTSTAELVSQ